MMRSPLVGSHESLARQNDKTENDNLERIEDEDDLADRIARKVLVPVPASASLTVNGELPANRRYCRPWTAIFLAELAKVHAAQFHKPIEVSLGGAYGGVPEAAHARQTEMPRRPRATL